MLIFISNFKYNQKFTKLEVNEVLEHRNVCTFARFQDRNFLDIIQFYLFLSNQGASGEMSSRVYTLLSFLLNFLFFFNKLFLPNIYATNKQIKKNIIPYKG